MKIDKINALCLWEEHYGRNPWAKDFAGRLMYRDAYGDDDALAFRSGSSYIYQESGTTNFFRCPSIHCGWNIHHILPKTKGGTAEKSNLICTNIITNDEAENKITFWIDDHNYQVQRIPETSRHEIVWLNESKPTNMSLAFGLTQK